MKGHKDHEWTGVCLLQGEAERVGTVQLGEAKAQEDVINAYKCLKVDGARLFPVVPSAQQQ